MGSLVAVLLDSARDIAELTRHPTVCARRRCLQPHRLSLNECIASQRGAHAGLLAADVAFELALSGDLWTVSVDPGRLEFVLNRLVQNAAEAVHQVGRVRLETVKVTPAGDEGVLTVSDSGAGMDRETVSRIVEPFFRDGGSLDAAGVGLAVAHGIVKQHGGAILVCSDENQGSRFELYLPAAGERD